MALTFAGWRTWGPFAIPWFYSIIKGNKKKPTPEVEIIGVQSPDLLQKTSSGTDLTETIFDTTTRPDEARILLTNASGVAQILRGCYVRGKVIKKVGGDSGYCNDKHVDYEAIARDGESKFELGNDYICTLTQVNKLADWHWKLNKTKKHIYTVSLKGFQSYFEPGEWYVLTIGSAGTAEYIDSTVECYSVRCAYDAKGTMGTQVSFREVEENWKFDSNAVARYVAAGGHNRNPQGDVVTIAAYDYDGYADYYCDGTSGDVDTINQASSVSSNKTIRFTNGNFNITKELNPYSNICYEGQGDGTNLIWSGTAIDATQGAFSGVATSSDQLENIRITNMRISYSTSANNPETYLAYFDWVSGLRIDNVHFESGFNSAITAHNVKSSMIVSNLIEGCTSGSTGDLYALEMASQPNSYDNIINGNIIKQIYGGRYTAGIRAISTDLMSFDIGNNRISNINCNSTATASYGILCDANNVTINGNYITNVKNSVTSTQAYGLMIVGNNCKVSDNYCINNGGDTGLDNSHRNNFYDNGTDTIIG